jgi:hypothetical protein
VAASEKVKQASLVRPAASSPGLTQFLVKPFFVLLSVSFVDLIEDFQRISAMRPFEQGR